MEVNILQECNVEFREPASHLALHLSTDARIDILLVADAPVDVLVSDHR